MPDELDDSSDDELDDDSSEDELDELVAEHSVSRPTSEQQHRNTKSPPYPGYMRTTWPTVTEF